MFVSDGVPLNDVAMQKGIKKGQNIVVKYFDFLLYILHTSKCKQCGGIKFVLA